jgi:hypothetical protein
MYYRHVLSILPASYSTGKNKITWGHFTPGIKKKGFDAPRLL